MCGIAGLVGFPREVAAARVGGALRCLVHRGPDGEGLHVGEEAVLGMRRLAIIDLAGGDQPIYNEDRSVATVCNGELYEFVEQFERLIRSGHRLQSRSDVNMIPHLYEEHGRALFREVRGMFAAAVWDDRERQLVLARDRAGKKPLFYARVGEGLAFASELGSLLTLLDSVPPISARAVGDYLRLGFIPHPETIYEGVFALPPGCTLTFRPGGSPHVESYWRPGGQPAFRGSHADALTELDARLAEAVSLRLRSDVPVGLFLSGGIDSGLVASYAAQAGARDLLCFVVEVADERLNEADAARLTASHLGLPIETITLSFAPRDMIERLPQLYGQPFADSSAIPSFFVSQAASRLRKVVLNGDGGDEVFAGYRRYWMGQMAPALLPLSAPFRPALGALGRRLARAGERRSGLGFAARAARGLAMDRHARYLAWTGDLLSDADMERCFPALAAEGSTLARLEELRGERTSADSLREFMVSDYRLILADGLLTKMDVATMANSLEARSPFLDVPLAEFAWSLPEAWMLNRKETKPLLRELARRRLPATIAAAPKRGFEVPVAQWLKTELRDVVHDTLLGSDSRVLAMGDDAALRRLVGGTDGFMGNHAQTVWALLVLEMFLRSAPGTADRQSGALSASALSAS